MAEYLGDGVYRIGKGQRLLSVRQSRLEDAVLPVPGAEADGSAFGWLRGTALPEPPDHGCYVVEFLPSDNVRVLAYVDWFGRAFTVAEATNRPLACAENLYMAHEPGNDAKGGLFVRDADGQVSAVAAFTQRGSGKSAKYDLSGFGYDFGPHGRNLHYFDMMARAYLAFVYRPTLTGAALPITVADVFQKLSTVPVGRALPEITDAVAAAQKDPSLAVPPSVALLARWLQDAGVRELAAHPAAAANLALVRTVRYADTYFIRIQDADEPQPPMALIWALEGALNRFLHLVRRFADGEAPTLEQCLEADATFIEGFAAAQPQLTPAEDVPRGRADGEWETRLALAAGIENLAAPFRLETRFRYDHGSGEALFDLRVPPSTLFGGEGSGTGEPTAAKQLAQRYAMHGGLYMAAMAFAASDGIQRVRVMARPIPDSLAFGEGDEDAPAAPARLWMDVTFTREAFDAGNSFGAERAGNPVGAYATAAEGSTCQAVMAFDGLEPLPDFWEQGASLELLEGPVGQEAAEAWAASTHRDMAIEFGAGHRMAARAMADALAGCAGASEAVKAVRDIQEAMAPTLDGRPADEAFTRLLKALAEGAVEPSDAEAVIACFQGPDPCLEAYQRAQALEADDKAEQAVPVLAEAVARAMGEDGFADTDATAYRVFDNYWSRLLYNRQRAGLTEGNAVVRADEGKAVQLAPDYLYFCLLDLVGQLEGAFDGSEDAIRYGKAAVALAPTVGAAYRLLGRAYMLIGELDNAAATLQQGLRVMQGSDDIAATYYQLAYVLWHAGQPEQGALCYAKSLMTSPVMVEPASSELRELQESTGVELPDPEGVDELLAQAGLVVAPVAEMGAVLMEGAVAAMDEGLLPAARNLLAAVGNYNRDDALMGVLNSLAA